MPSLDLGRGYRVRESGRRRACFECCSPCEGRVMLVAMWIVFWKMLFLAKVLVGG